MALCLLQSYFVINHVRAAKLEINLEASKLGASISFSASRWCVITQPQRVTCSFNNPLAEAPIDPEQAPTYSHYDSGFSTTPVLPSNGKSRPLSAASVLLGHSPAFQQICPSSPILVSLLQSTISHPQVHVVWRLRATLL